jgi:hypothetical protein
LNEYQQTHKVDSIQANIVLQYERSYFATMNDLVFYLEHQAESRDSWIAITQTGLLVSLILNEGVAYYLAKKRQLLERLERGETTS